MEKTHYALRLTARMIDLLLVVVIVLAIEKLVEGLYINVVLAYLFYGLVVAAFDGKSLGKFVLSLEVQSDHYGIWNRLARMIREILLLILLPLIFLNFLSISPLPLHDRISGTRVVRDET